MSLRFLDFSYLFAMLLIFYFYVRLHFDLNIAWNFQEKLQKFLLHNCELLNNHTTTIIERSEIFN